MEINETFKTEIYDELLVSKEKGVLTQRLENLLKDLIASTINKRYGDAPYGFRVTAKADALDACRLHVLKFNPDRSSNAFTYCVQVIRCSAAQTIVRLKKRNR